jgi:hypothetical protein
MAAEKRLTANTVAHPRPLSHEGRGEKSLLDRDEARPRQPRTDRGFGVAPRATRLDSAMTGRSNAVGAPETDPA